MSYGKKAVSSEPERQTRPGGYEGKEAPMIWITISLAAIAASFKVIAYGTTC